MKYFTFLMIPDGSGQTRQFKVPAVVFKIIGAGLLFSLIVGSYLVYDYMSLRSIKAEHQKLLVESQGIKSEARRLQENLTQVKGSLRKIQDFTSKINNVVTVKMAKVHKRTGIGPLTVEEEKVRQKNLQKGTPAKGDIFSLGLHLDKLAFKTVFDHVSQVGRSASQEVVRLRTLLSTLSREKQLLNAVPTVNPVDGWISSGFGHRVSPFTGKKTLHRGIDVAAPAGTEIMSPADGIVIFSGVKSGYGNFVMVAHGNGIVTKYGHNAENLVKAGDQVRRGDKLATVGSSGRSTGPHLHYEVWLNGKPSNPKQFILQPSESVISMVY